MKELLSHLFLPNRTNNYRPKLLHHRILVALIVLFFSAGLIMSFVRNNYPSVLGTYSNITAQQLLDLTNQKRQENGLSPLSLNNELSQAASNKALDMFSKDYWAHFAPDGTTPWSFIKAAGYNYTFAGENLARGFYSASDVVNAWMASPDHRKNMLSANYQNIGFAAETGKLSGEDTVLVVEMLGSTSLASAPVAKEGQKPQTEAIAPGSPLAANSAAKKGNTLAVAQNNAKVNTANVVLSSLPNTKPLINSQYLSLNIVSIVLFLFMSILILDMVIIERKKIVRFVGHNLDHAIFFSVIMIIILVLIKGSIL